MGDNSTTTLMVFTLLFFGGLVLTLYLVGKLLQRWLVRNSAFRALLEQRRQNVSLKTFSTVAEKCSMSDLLKKGETPVIDAIFFSNAETNEQKCDV